MNKLRILPSALESLVKLENLDVSSSKLTQVIYVGGTFWNLKKIDVSNNEKMNLSSLLLGLSFLENLKEITLSDYSEKYTLPKEIALLNVEKIVIRNTVIGKLEPSLGRNKALRNLVFENGFIWFSRSLKRHANGRKSK